MHRLAYDTMAQLAEGNRSMLDRFALSKRPYLGTTSMDTELAFLMANQGLVRHCASTHEQGAFVDSGCSHGCRPFDQVRLGSIVVDPFVGTGTAARRPDRTASSLGSIG